MKNMDLTKSVELHSQSSRLIKKELLTPTNEHVDNKVSVFWKDDDQQRVEVQTFHQQPEEVGHDEVLEKHQAGFTSQL